MMEKHELESLLNIKPKKKLVETVSLEFDRSGEIKEGTYQDGFSMLDVDEWEEEVGRKLHGGDETEGWDDERSPLKMSELFAACFREQPEVKFQIPDARFQEFVEQMLESPDFWSLHESTKGNLAASELATKEFANQYAQLVRKDQEREGTSSNSPAGKGSKGKRTAADVACQRAVNNAINHAQAEVEQMQDIQNAVGCGESGSKDGRMDTEQVVRSFNRVKNNGQLRRICELAGSYRRMAQAKQRAKTIHGYDDMIGVELSGDVGRLLPLELAKLADPEFEDDAMRRLIEKQSMCRQYRGVEKVGKGPIVICVDESGSMAGNNICQAKAFALSMYWVAKHQNRWCWLTSFADSGTSIYGLLIPPGKDESMGVINWLEHFYGGGTDMRVPFEAIPSQWSKCPKGKTDMIVITDGQVDVPPAMKERFLKFKKEQKVKLITIAIGWSAGEVGKVSDEVYAVNGIDVNGDAVQRCMSI